MRIQVDVDGKPQVLDFASAPSDQDIDDAVRSIRASRTPQPKPLGGNMPTGQQMAPMSPVAPGMNVRPVQGQLPKVDPLHATPATMYGNLKPPIQQKSAPQPQAPGAQGLLNLAALMGQNGIVGGAAKAQAGYTPSPAQGQGAGILVNNTGAPNKPKGPLLPSDFKGLPFDYQNFIYSVRTGHPVVGKDGKSVPLQHAATLVAAVTGKKIPNIDTTTQSQQEEQQAQDAYTANGKSGVGKNVGFNRNQADSNVPRGTKQRELYIKKNQNPDGTPKSRTQGLRDSVNQTTDEIQQALKNAASSDVAQTVLGPLGAHVLKSTLGSDLVTGLAAGAATFPMSFGADAQTASDPSETPENQARAAANVSIALGAELIGKPLAAWAGKKIAGSAIFKSIVEKIKGTPVEQAIIHAADEAAAVTEVQKMGVSPEHAREVVRKVRTIEVGKGVAPGAQPAPKPKVDVVVYHGSPDVTGINESGKFMSLAERHGQPPSSSDAHFFTDDPKIAASYADANRAFDYQSANPGVVKARVQMHNPLVVDWNGESWKGGGTDSTGRVWKSTREITQYAKDNGYDGLVVHNVVDPYNTVGVKKKFKPATNYVVFDTKNIEVNPSELKPHEQIQETTAGNGPTIQGPGNETVQGTGGNESGGIGREPGKEEIRQGEVQQPSQKGPTEEVTPSAVETRNADTEAARRTLGLPDVERQHYTTKAEGDAAGREAIKNGADHVALAEQIASKPRPINTTENGILKEGLRQLYEDVGEARAARDKATAAGDLETAAMHEQKYRHALGLIDRNTEALVKGGRETSAALAIRRGGLPTDYSNPDAVLNEARWKKGDGTKPVELTTKEHKRLLKVIADHEKANADLRAKLDATEVTNQTKAEATQVIKQRATRAKRTHETIRADRAAAIDEFHKATLEASSRASSGVPITTAQIKALGRIAKTVVEEGALTVEEMVTKVRTHLGKSAEGITDEQIADSILYREPATPKDKTDFQRLQGELRAKKVEVAKAKAAAERNDMEEMNRLTREAVAKDRADTSANNRMTQERMQKLRADARAEAQATRRQRAKDYEKLFGEQSRLENSIADLKEKFNTKNYDKKPPKVEDPELQRLRNQRDFLRNQINREIESLKPKTAADKIVGGIRDIAGIPRTIKTSFDLSAPFRQSVMLSINHPGLATKAFRAQLKAFADPVFSHAHNSAILEGANAPLYRKAGLYLSDAESNAISAHEEEFVSRLAGKIPGVKHSERAYTTYLNTMRSSVFDQLRSPGMSDKELAGLANFINVSTGRGSLGMLDKSANGMAQILFSPRNLASRFQLLAGQPLAKSGGLKGAKVVATEYAKFAAAIITVMKIAEASGAKVEYKNYQDPDWLKLKIGDTRIDLLAGLQQAARVALRLGAARHDERAATQVALKFVRSKLAPTPGYAYSAYTGKDFIGQPFDIKDAAKDSVTPLIVQDTLEAMRAQGIPQGFAIGILSGLGVGVNTYSKTDKKQDQNVYDSLYEKATGR